METMLLGYGMSGGVGFRRFFTKGLLYGVSNVQNANRRYLLPFQNSEEDTVGVAPSTVEQLSNLLTEILVFSC